jgi:uncharacterized repeat protein (TIGR01451 family)
LVVAGAFPTGTYGAVWVNAAGDLHALRHSNGGGAGEIYVWTGGATASFVGSDPQGTFNDGCSCLDAPYLGKRFNNAFIDTGQTDTITFRVVNGPTAKTVDFSDQLPADLRFVPGTLAPANPFGGTPNAFGNTQLLTITGLSLPAGADATFTIDVQALAPGSHFNQAILSGATNIPLGASPFPRTSKAVGCSATLRGCLQTRRCLRTRSALRRA